MHAGCFGIHIAQESRPLAPETARNPYDVYHSTTIPPWGCLIYFVHFSGLALSGLPGNLRDYKLHMNDDSTRSS